MQIAFLTILYFSVTECEITKAIKSKDDLEFWKPDKNFNELSQSTTKRPRKLMKNDKPFFRHGKKQKGASSRWPKILRTSTTETTQLFNPDAATLQGKNCTSKQWQFRNYRYYRTPISTKMHMMLQEREKTTVIDLNESIANEVLSSYSIKQQLENIAEHIPNSNVTLEVIGRTIEYQDIVLLKITEEVDRDKYFRADDDKYADDKPEKKIIFIVHGLSVMGMRELECLSSTPSFHTLVSYYVQHLDKFDIFLIPMANPDGYAILNQIPIWNKNAAPQAECAGVALDRNFDVAWSTNRSISSCSQEYPGNTPFSEAETKAIRDVFHKYSHKIIAYFNVHSGTYGTQTYKGDAVLYPKGYTDSITDEDKYIDLKGEIDEAIRNASFQVFSVAVETLHNWYGKVTGSSVDYASTVYGIPFALELVMQLYDNENVSDGTETYSDSALSEVWSRVIDVLFEYIWKSTNKGNEVR